MEVEGGLASYPCIRGNVETELARLADVGAGCGCACPASVDDDTVQRSNLILEALRPTAARLEDVRERHWALPAHLVADVNFPTAEAGGLSLCIRDLTRADTVTDTGMPIFFSPSGNKPAAIGYGLTWGPGPRNRSDHDCKQRRRVRVAPPQSQRRGFGRGDCR